MLSITSELTGNLGQLTVDEMIVAADDSYTTARDSTPRVRKNYLTTLGASLRVGVTAGEGDIMGAFVCRVLGDEEPGQAGFDPDPRPALRDGAAPAGPPD